MHSTTSGWLQNPPQFPRKDNKPNAYRNTRKKTRLPNPCRERRKKKERRKRKKKEERREDTADTTDGAARRHLSFVHLNVQSTPFVHPLLHRFLCAFACRVSAWVRACARARVCVSTNPTAMQRSARSCPLQTEKGRCGFHQSPPTFLVISASISSRISLERR
jgi:hypothetical protein